MKRAISIFFLLVFLSTSSIVNQLFKLPNLIEHFALHQHDHDHNASSFLDFLKEHYSNTSSHNTQAKHHHDNLPFKTIDAHASQIIMLNFQSEVFTFLKANLEIEHKETIYSNISLQSAYLNGVWQPPKAC